MRKNGFSLKKNQYLSVNLPFHPHMLWFFICLNYILNRAWIMILFNKNKKRLSMPKVRFQEKNMTTTTKYKTFYRIMWSHITICILLLFHFIPFFRKIEFEISRNENKNYNSNNKERQNNLEYIRWTKANKRNKKQKIILITVFLFSQDDNL